ncbi:MAG TPA: DUF971 domain-containing protein [Chthoniobacteraceae bacterium]|nr:DUF971 domain-containing protein [Chthoniobacteraceae bacterium]
MRLEPLQIQIIGQELAIAWSDGTETYLPLEFLRRHCPCAGCGGEPDVMGQIDAPEVTHTEASFRMRRYVLMGGYAFMPTWEDGHNTGLYTFHYLKRLQTALEASGDGQE